MNPKNDRRAEALGWFSLALGALEVAAPDALAHFLGLSGKGRLVRAFGMREIATGIGLLAAENKAPWLLARVAGDGADLVTLAAGARQNRNARWGLAAVAGVTALDLACAARAAGPRLPPRVARDYSDRSGFPAPPERMRGAARDYSAARVAASSLSRHSTGTP